MPGSLSTAVRFSISAFINEFECLAELLDASSWSWQPPQIGQHAPDFSFDTGKGRSDLHSCKTREQLAEDCVCRNRGAPLDRAFLAERADGGLVAMSNRVCLK